MELLKKILEVRKKEKHSSPKEKIMLPEKHPVFLKNVGGPDCDNAERTVARVKCMHPAFLNSELRVT